jgi:hypothetical protein
LKVKRNGGIDSQNLNLSITTQSISYWEIRVTDIGDEIMDGSFQSTDRGVPELPDLVTAGTVRMVKQAAPNL